MKKTINLSISGTVNFNYLINVKEIRIKYNKRYSSTSNGKHLF